MKTDLYVEVLDTTLRDGEQTPGVSFTPKEKLDIARMLRRLKVDRIEIGSARVSDGEGDGVKKILSWSEDHDNPEKFEMLGMDKLQIEGGARITVDATDPASIDVEELNERIIRALRETKE